MKEMTLAETHGLRRVHRSWSCSEDSLQTEEWILYYVAREQEAADLSHGLQLPNYGNSVKQKVCYLEYLNANHLRWKKQINNRFSI